MCRASAYVRSCDPAFTCACQSVCMHACVRACVRVCVRACARAERAASVSVSVYARVTECVRAHACGRTSGVSEAKDQLETQKPVKLTELDATVDFFLFFFYFLSDSTAKH